MTEPGKTIVLKMKYATIHRRHPASTARVDIVSGLSVPVGEMITTEILPNTPVELPEDEARALLAVARGEIVEGARR